VDVIRENGLQLHRDGKRFAVTVENGAPVCGERDLSFALVRRELGKARKLPHLQHDEARPDRNKCGRAEQKEGE
jgi:hypothetical protein